MPILQAALIQKRYLGTVHNTKVFAVDFNQVKLMEGEWPEAADATEGVNSCRFGFCPKGEAWVDANVSPKCWRPIILHEILEQVLCSPPYNLTYLAAHPIANLYEMEYRRELGVGTEGGQPVAIPPGFTSALSAAWQETMPNAAPEGFHEALASAWSESGAVPDKDALHAAMAEAWGGQPEGLTANLQEAWTEASAAGSINEAMAEGWDETKEPWLSLESQYTAEGSPERYTESPEFKAWFGNSKVVHPETGKPLVVYHGTPGEFHSFDNDKTGGVGFYFAKNPEIASTYARENVHGDKKFSVMPVYLSIQKPLSNQEYSERYLRKAGGGNPRRQAVQKAIEDGYDGVVGNEQVIAFHPHQIKSATGNAGTYSPQTADIRYSCAAPSKYSMTNAEIEEAVKGWKEPSKEQVAAENYKKPRVRIHGLTVAIENPKGTVRKAGWRPLAAHYGYVAKVEGNPGPDGRDKDRLDVFVGPHPRSEIVFVIDQEHPSGRYDEAKAILGAFTEDEARKLYLDSYQDGWHCGPITALTVGQFKEWLQHGNTKERIAGQVSKYSYLSDRGWIGVQLDGQLARWQPEQNQWHIGEPIPEMVNRIQQWLAEGRDVRIVTPRVYGPDAERQRPLIEQWCRNYIGRVLPITFSHDPDMHRFDDDRAIMAAQNSLPIRPMDTYQADGQPEKYAAHSVALERRDASGHFSKEGVLLPHSTVAVNIGAVVKEPEKAAQVLAAWQAANFDITVLTDNPDTKPQTQWLQQHRIPFTKVTAQQPGMPVDAHVVLGDNLEPPKVDPAAKFEMDAPDAGAAEVFAAVEEGMAELERYAKFMEGQGTLFDMEPRGVELGGKEFGDKIVQPKSSPGQMSLLEDPQGRMPETHKTTTGQMTFIPPYENTKQFNGTPKASHEVSERYHEWRSKKTGKDSPPTYLTGADTPETRELAARHPGLGLLITPFTAKYVDKHHPYSHVAVDNGVWSEFVGTAPFDRPKFLSLLDRVAKNPEASKKTLFVTAPDVVGDWQGTLQRSAPYFDEIHKRGLPAAFVAQDGIEHHMDQIPWDKFETLFIGGSTAWKQGVKTPDGAPMHKVSPSQLENMPVNREFIELLREAKRRGKHIHFGRVNSPTRFDLTSYGLGGDSADGTYAKFASRTNTPHIEDWVDEYNPNRELEKTTERRKNDPAESDDSEDTEGLNSQQVLAKQHWQSVQDAMNDLERYVRQPKSSPGQLSIFDAPVTKPSQPQESLVGGKADNVPDAAFPKAALSQGTAHEMEHTSDQKAASEIAKDHLLSEGDSYYDDLEEMERAKAAQPTHPRAGTDYELPSGLSAEYAKGDVPGHHVLMGQPVSFTNAVGFSSHGKVIGAGTMAAGLPYLDIQHEDGTVSRQSPEDVVPVQQYIDERRKAGKRVDPRRVPGMPRSVAEYADAAEKAAPHVSQEIIAGGGNMEEAMLQGITPAEYAKRAEETYYRRNPQKKPVSEARARAMSNMETQHEELPKAEDSPVESHPVESLSDMRKRFKDEQDSHRGKLDETMKRLSAEKSRTKNPAKREELDAQWRAFKEQHSQDATAMYERQRKEIESHPERQQEREQTSQRAKQMQAESSQRDAAAAEKSDADSWEKIASLGGHEKVVADMEAELRKSKGILARTAERNKFSVESRIRRLESDIAQVKRLAAKFGQPERHTSAAQDALACEFYSAGLWDDLQMEAYIQKGTVWTEEHERLWPREPGGHRWTKRPPHLQLEVASGKPSTKDEDAAYDAYAQLTKKAGKKPLPKKLYLHFARARKIAEKPKEQPDARRQEPAPADAPVRIPNPPAAEQGAAQS